MSIRVMTLVWDRSDLSGVQLLALLAIADNADDEGVAWPSHEYLAAKTRQSDRNVRRILDRVVASGELELVERGTYGRSNRYLVKLDVLETRDPKMSALRGAQADISGDSGGQLGLLKADTTCPPNRQQEPSQREPSKEELLTEKIDAIWTRWDETFPGRTRGGLTVPRRTTLKKALSAVDGDLDVCLNAIAGFKSWLDRNPDKNQTPNIDRVFSTGMHDFKNLTDKIQDWAKDGTGRKVSALDAIPQLHRPIVSQHIRIVNRKLTGRAETETEIKEADESAAWLLENWQLVGRPRDDGTISWEKTS
jgi:hypothetical protein